MIGRPIVFRPRGLTDSIDGTNAFAGAMNMLQNLIPSPGDRGIYVPRPAATGIIGGGTTPAVWGDFTWGAADWGGFGAVAGAAQITCCKVVGNIVYGMVASTAAPYSGKDVPFAYDLLTSAFLSISIPQGTNSLPTTQATTGDWTPPRMDVVGSRIIFTHPGFAGVTYFMGWLDVSSFSSNTITGDTHSSTTIDSLASDVLTAGWEPGMTISGSGIPADTVIMTIAANGLSCTISQAATATATGVTLTVAGGTATAPLWAAGNTNGQGLVSVPTDVLNFNGRAYYAVGTNGMQYSDSGKGTQITNTTQALKPQNGLAVTCFGGLPYSQYQGGILQALIAFQGDSQMQSVTGDQALSNLAMNAIGVGVGTAAPNTVSQTPLGLMFLAPDGIRYINFLGVVSDPIGAYGSGVHIPFLNAVNPSRSCAAYNEDVFRITIQNGAATGEPYQEYWFHVSLKSWSGPHTCACDLIQPYQSPSSAISGHGFIGTLHGINATLYDTPVVPTINSSYTENNSPLTCQWRNTLLPDNQMMVENKLVETMFALSPPTQGNVEFLAANEQGTTLDSVTISTNVSPGATWGSFIWGNALWGPSAQYFAQYDVPWHNPLVFKQMTITATFTAAANAKIGNMYIKPMPLGYRLQTAYGATGGNV